MTPLVNRLALATAGLLVASPASAQVQNALQRAVGIPSGLALPVLGVAVAEEPSGISTTPAAPGFVRQPALQYFHESGVTEDSNADGVYFAAGLGPVGIGYTIEWVRPGDPVSRWRKNTLALSVGDGQSFSLGAGWHRFWSSDPAVDSVKSWDVGLTVRPSRHLSIGAAMLDRDAKLGDTYLPLRYDLGVATRFWDDTLTLSADLLADDRARDDFHVTHLALGAGAELRGGLALAVQVAVPIAEVQGLKKETSAVVALTWNGPHLGVTGGVTAIPGQTGGFGGVRASGERYRSAGSGRDVPTFDVSEEMEPDRLFGFAIGERDPYGRLLGRLASAGADPDVAAVALRIDDLPFDAARIEELRRTVSALAARKPVLAYVTGGGTLEYWLATAATAVAVPPGETLDVSGLVSTRLFLRDALARLGVGFDVIARGPYKSAPEPLVRQGSSPEAREATNAVLDDIFGRFVLDVASTRRLAPERVRAIVDQGLLSPEEARAAGLVDEVMWPDELEGWARRLTGRRVRSIGSYRPDADRRAQTWGTPAVIEIVRVEGTIVQGKSRPGPLGREAIAGAKTITAQIRRAAGDRQVKAIVLRVDSPGGDGLASDLIWREVIRARAKKPVIASMGDFAASGGYLAAVGADTVLAEPSTLTGSIGVFALKPDFSGLLHKLSISREAYARGDNAQYASLAKPWTAPERRAVERQVDVFYAMFVGRVAEGRKLPRAEIEAVAGGRVWTGKQAFERRLVDRLGTLTDAIVLAAERAHLSPDDFVDIRRASDGAGDFADLVQGSDAAAAAPIVRLASALPEVRALALLSEMGPVLALPVEWVLPGQ